MGSEFPISTNMELVRYIILFILQYSSAMKSFVFHINLVLFEFVFFFFGVSITWGTDFYVGIKNRFFSVLSIVQ